MLYNIDIIDDQGLVSGQIRNARISHENLVPNIIGQEFYILEGQSENQWFRFGLQGLIVDVIGENRVVVERTEEWRIRTRNPLMPEVLEFKRILTEFLIHTV